ncbi:hypothetical protein ABZ215_13510 [Amycolatopsis sp. NPDC006131]|uniref:hypothetical protein n=1 Tax=Amycolatopsis sp. NPDC006131 TaxID=3156731 RepID=UPI0033B28F97
MGFEPPQTVLVLNFDEDTGMDGLVVKARWGSVAEILHFEHEWPDIFRALKDGEITMLEAEKRMAAVFDWFVDLIVEWNIGPDDAPLPITRETMRSFEPAFCTKLVRGWHSGHYKVDAPLAKPSSDGDPSLEASIPMESLSESLAS